jgi:hypothetical protein
MNCIRKQGMKTMLTGLPVTTGLISNIVINNKPINYWEIKMDTKPIRKVVYHTIYLIARLIKSLKKPWSMRYISVKHAIRKTIRDKYYYYDYWLCPVCHQRLDSYSLPDYGNETDRDYSVCRNPGCPLYGDAFQAIDDIFNDKNQLIEILRDKYGEHTFPVYIANRLDLSKYPLSKSFWKMCIEISNLIQKIKEDYNEYK